MQNDVYKILYCSRNMMSGDAAEQDAAIRQILASSRINNQRLEVTGALLFSAESFAQVLEGPKDAVEETFERIQRDIRHGDVTVLNSGGSGPRDFANWSMAYVQPPSKEQSDRVAAALDLALLHPNSEGAGVLDLLRSLVLQAD